jgi:hypothetical protein
MSTTEQIVLLLIQERDRLSNAIEALQGPAKRKGRPPKSAVSAFDYNAPNVPDWVKPASAKAPAMVTPKKRIISAAGRKAIADAVKRRWAAIKAAKVEVAAPSEDEAFKKRMSEVMKASWAKRKKAAAAAPKAASIKAPWP